MTAVLTREPAPSAPQAEPAITRRRRDWRHTLSRWAPAAVLAVVLGYLVVVPLVILLWSSLRPTGLPGDPGITGDNYASVYAEPGTYVLFANSAIFAVGSTVLALVLGVGLAWLVERSDMPGRRVFRVLVIIPMAMPPVLLAIAWVLLLSPQIGLFNQVLQGVFGLDSAPFDIYSMGGMIFVQALSLVPTTYLIVSPSFRNMDPALEEAALTSGVPPRTVLLRIVLPMVWPSILSAGAFLLIIGFVVFDIPGLLGMPEGIYVLSSEILFRSQPPTGLPDYGGISALAASFIVILVALSWYYHRQIKRSQRFVTITGKATRARTFALGRWRYVAATGAWLYFVLGVGAPLGILAWTSLLPYYSGVTNVPLDQLGLDNHAALLADATVLEAAGNSVVVAVVAAAAVTLLSAITSWVVIRSHAPGRRLLDAIAFVPLAIPSTMIGLALIFVYLTFNSVPVYGTIWILVIAYTTTYLSFGTRVTNSVLLQMSPELEESARTSGAGWTRMLRSVTLPLMRPALIAVWMWTAAHALRELSAALMLQGRDNAVLPTLLWGYWEGGRPTVAAAAGVWLIIALSLVMCLWALATSRTRRVDFR